MIQALPATRRGKAFAGAYLGLVAGVAVFVTITFVVGEAAGNLAPVWLFAVTLPWSTLLVASPGLVWHVSLAGLVIAAAVNARLLGALGDHTALGP